MAAMRVFVLLAIAMVFAGAVQALEKDQVLVLVGNNAIQHTHSKYFSILQGMHTMLHWDYYYPISSVMVLRLLKW